MFSVAAATFGVRRLDAALAISPPISATIVIDEEVRRYIETDLMKREPHPDAKPMGAFSIGQRPE